jgi:ParB-like chromosome segregation protein Spo0J
MSGYNYALKRGKMMEIRKIPINDINPAPYNPRKDLKPGDSEYEKLKRSIDEFDLVEPLVWNETTGNLVGGHQRLKILVDRGDKEVEVSVVHLDDEHEKALNIALNKIQGDWDYTKLKDLLEELDTGNIDIELTGFDNDELEKLMTQIYEPANIDDLLEEIDVKKAIDKPIWAVIRTDGANKNLVEKTLELLERNGIKVERSYEQ